MTNYMTKPNTVIFVTYCKTIIKIVKESDIFNKLYMTITFKLTFLIYHTTINYLIIDTSFAPSPMARVTADFRFFTISTTRAFCKGVTRQHITARH